MPKIYKENTLEKLHEYRWLFAALFVCLILGYGQAMFQVILSQDDWSVLDNPFGHTSYAFRQGRWLRPLIWNLTPIKQINPVFNYFTNFALISFAAIILLRSIGVKSQLHIFIFICLLGFNPYLADQFHFEMHFFDPGVAVALGLMCAYFSVKYLKYKYLRFGRRRLIVGAIGVTLVMATAIQQSFYIFAVCSSLFCILYYYCTSNRFEKTDLVILLVTYAVSGVVYIYATKLFWNLYGVTAFSSGPYSFEIDIHSLVDQATIQVPKAITSVLLKKGNYHPMLTKNLFLGLLMILLVFLSTKFRTYLHKVFAISSVVFVGLLPYSFVFLKSNFRLTSLTGLATYYPFVSLFVLTLTPFLWLKQIAQIISLAMVWALVFSMSAGNVGTGLNNKRDFMTANRVFYRINDVAENNLQKFELVIVGTLPKDKRKPFYNRSELLYSTRQSSVFTDKTANLRHVFNTISHKETAAMAFLTSEKSIKEYTAKNKKNQFLDITKLKASSSWPSTKSVYKDGKKIIVILGAQSKNLLIRTLEKQ